MKELTKAEEQVMQILWEMKRGYVKDIRARFRNPKPAITTVSTIIRILEKKGFIAHKASGRTFEYYPAVEKRTYARVVMKSILMKYFGNSLRQMVSFFAQEKGLTASELVELKIIIEEEIRKQEKP
jgi:BlaI family transcriptional regulator, penicillinase repressor